MPDPTPYRVRARNLATDSENKIHDDDVAQRFGFTGGLVPGVELFAYASHPLVEAWGEEFLTGGTLEVRFRQPVYDGDGVVVEVGDADDGWFPVTLETESGTARAVGRASRREDSRTDLGRYLPAPLPATPHSIGGDLPSGPLGSVSQPVDATAHDAYLDGIGETLPYFREAGVVHPGALLRMVNNVLMQNVALGPWIHTSSACHFLGLARIPSTLEAHGIVRECFERNGNAYVRYDCLVRSDGEPVAEVDHTAIYRLGAASG